MKPVTLKPIEIGYGDEKIVIRPRMMSVAEQDELTAQFADISDTDTDKYQKEFEICRDALDAFSAQPAAQLVKEKGEYKRVPIEGGLTKHFADRSIEAERVVREAYQLVLLQQRPESRFI